MARQEQTVEQQIRGADMKYAITLDDCVIGSIGAFRQGNIHSCTAELGYYLA